MNCVSTLFDCELVFVKSNTARILKKHGWRLCSPILLECSVALEGISPRDNANFFFLNLQNECIHGKQIYGQFNSQWIECFS